MFPLVALIVSGGHTFLVEMRDHLTYRLLGQTVDDAAGEAFDKVGRLLGLPYPGGPAISARRRGRAPPRCRVPAGVARRQLRLQLQRPQDGGAPDDRRGAGRRGPADAAPPRSRARRPLSDGAVAELSWGFQDAVVDVLVTKTIRAAEETGARSIVLGGGVAANGALRTRLAGEAEARGLPLIVPRPALCTDNGAMIGAAGARRFAAGERAGPRPRREPVPAAGPPMTDVGPGDDPRRAPVRIDPAVVRRTLKDAGLRARHAAQPELPRRPRGPRGDPRRGGGRPGSARPRDRARARAS